MAAASLPNEGIAIFAGGVGASCDFYFSRAVGVFDLQTVLFWVWGCEGLSMCRTLRRVTNIFSCFA